MTGGIIFSITLLANTVSINLLRNWAVRRTNPCMQMFFFFFNRNFFFVLNMSPFPRTLRRKKRFLNTLLEKNQTSLNI